MSPETFTAAQAAPAKPVYAPPPGKQRQHLLKPGQLLHLDFRQTPTNASGGKAVPAPAQAAKSIRLIQWNIERGYKLEAVIEELRRCDADVIALQEVDVGCERSGGEDTGHRIAEALHMNYVFFCEFEELWSPLREPSAQGGGVHGNAILSRFDLSDTRVIQHREHPVNWENPTHALAQREPRRGCRAVLAATVHVPQGLLLVYNLHLEVFCGILARVAQFADVLRDSREQLGKGLFHQAILADLNTMAHGIARLSPHYCCDAMRFRSLGQTEAEWWHHNVLAAADPAYQPATDANRPPAPATAQPNPQLLRLGVREDVCQGLLNPGFQDPFDVRKDVTLDNSAYRFWGVSLMAGKLDWLLLRRLAVQSKHVGNHDYAASDHKWLSVDVAFES